MGNVMTCVKVGYIYIKSVQAEGILDENTEPVILQFGILFDNVFSTI